MRWWRRRTLCGIVCKQQLKQFNTSLAVAFPGLCVLHGLALTNGRLDRTVGCQPALWHYVADGMLTACRPLTAGEQVTLIHCAKQLLLIPHRLTGTLVMILCVHHRNALRKKTLIFRVKGSLFGGMLHFQYCTNHCEIKFQHLYF